MASIRYIVLSDLHLGEQSGLFSPIHPDGGLDLNQASDAFTAFWQWLASMIEATNDDTKPILILNGDILGLAFGTLDECLTVFGHLYEATCRADQALFERIIIVPGNHDHHLWEMSREANYIRALGHMASTEALRSMEHVTPPFMDDGISSTLLEQLYVQRFGSLDGMPPLRIVYPNLILQDSTDRALLIHHGHYAEDVYRFVSNSLHKLYPTNTHLPKTVESLEAQNFAWIDFGWSLLGRSGAFGEHLEHIMHTLSDPSEVKNQIEDLSKRLADAVDFPYLPFEWMERMLARTLILRVADTTQGERYTDGEVCTTETMGTLLEYVQNACYTQMRQYLGALPKELHFIWGHTHKPFTKHWHDAKHDVTMHIYNTGGWTIDTELPGALNGAGVVFINDALDIASMRIFQDDADAGTVPFAFDEIWADGGCAYQDELQALWDSHPEVRDRAQRFAEALQSQIRLRRTLYQQTSRP